MGTTLTRGQYARFVVVLGALIALGPLTIDMYLPALPRIADGFDAAESQVQLTLTGMLLGLAVGQLVVGPLSDALGRKRPLMVGLSVHALASLGCALSPNVEVLAGLRLLQGLAGAAVTVTAMAMVRDRFAGREMARLMARLVLVIGLAPILAPSFGGLVLTWFDWHVIFVALAAAAMLLIVIARLGLAETLPPARRRPPTLRATAQAYRRLLCDGRFVALAVVGGSMMATMFSYISGASFVFQNGFGLSEGAFALIFGGNALGYVIGTQLNAVLLRRLSMVQVLTAGVVGALLASSALTLAAVTGIGGLGSVLASLFVVTLSIGVSMPNTPALALEHHAGEAGTAAAVLGCMQFGIGGAVAPLVGAFGTVSGTSMGAVMVAMTGIAVLLVLAVVRPAARRAKQME